MGWEFTPPGNIVSGFGTALPGSPGDGDIFVLTDSITAPTYQWMLRYVAAKSSNKWIFIGGAWRAVTVDAAETTTSTTLVNLATDGPSMTWPVSGVYDTVHGGISFVNTGFNGNRFHLEVNGVDVAAPRMFVGGAIDGSGTMNFPWRHTSAVAGQTVKVKYSVDSDTGTFQNRFLRMIPVAIGG